MKHCAPNLLKLFSVYLSACDRQQVDSRTSAPSCAARAAALADTFEAFEGA